MSLVNGTVNQAQAAINRAAIQAAQTIDLGGVVQIDDALVFKSNQTISNGTLQQPFATNGTVDSRGTGIGYFDTITVNGPFQVTLADQTAVANYPLNGPAYFFHLNGFEDSVGQQLNTLRQVVAKGGATLSVGNGPPLDPRITAAKFFTRASPVGVVGQGQTVIYQNSGSLQAGDWVLLTDGPSVANEGRDEWHRIVAVTGRRIQLAWPTQRAYRTAVLAAAQPITGLTIKNVTFSQPTNWPYDTLFLKYCTSCLFDTVTIHGQSDFVGCAYLTFVNCTFDNIGMNSCHNCTFINCTFRDVWQEECCFNNVFEGCTFATNFSGNFAIERMTIRGGKLLAGSGNFLGLDTPNSLIENFTSDAGIFLSGDNWTVRNFTSTADFTAVAGNGFTLQAVKALTTTLGRSGQQSSGTTIDCWNITQAAGTWTQINSLNVLIGGEG